MFSIRKPANPPNKMIGMLSSLNDLQTKLNAAKDESTFEIQCCTINPAIKDVVAAFSTTPFKKLALKSLRKIDVNEFCRGLAALLETNQTIEELDVSGNQIDTEGAQRIAEALKKNKTLVKLHLTSHDVAIADSVLLEINRHLEANEKLSALTQQLTVLNAKQDITTQLTKETFATANTDDVLQCQAIAASFLGAGSFFRREVLQNKSQYAGLAANLQHEIQRQEADKLGTTPEIVKPAKSCFIPS